MNRKGIAFYFFCVLIITFTSCKSYEKAEIPAYLYVPSFQFTTANDHSQGEASSKIVDVWLDINGNKAGSFGLPALIPIIPTSSNITLSFMAGVMNSGQDDQRIIYPFYNTYEKTINLKPLETDTIIPTVTYASGLKFPFIEDFSIPNSNMLFVWHPKPGDSIIRANDSHARVKGNYYGAINISDSINDYIEIKMKTPDSLGFTKPSIGTRTYFEFDYYSNVLIRMGLESTSPIGDFNYFTLIDVNPKENWNKIYLDITNELNSLAANSKYKLWFRIYKNTDSQTNCYFDNFKIVSF